MTDSEFRSKRKKARKKAGVCTQCGREDAFTMVGRSYCSHCADIARESLEKARQDPEKYRKTLDCNLKKTARRKEAGLCPWCGKPAANGKVHCEECLKRERMRYRRKMEGKERTARGEYGMCYICNKREAIPGKRLCSECYDRNLRLIKKVNTVNTVARQQVEAFWKLKRAGMV